MTGEQDLATSPRARTSSSDPSTPMSGARFWPLAIGSIGVVFGDIGTSPLYAFRDAMGQTGAPMHHDSVLGVVSLALWALILVVTLKYVLFLMRADNRGEGGVLSLAALAQAATGHRTRAIFLLACAGAALFYGDAMITPAQTVLSAVEGLKTVPLIGPHVSLPVVLVGTLVILVSMFAVQGRGTSGVGRWFGPICVVWFLTIASLGVVHIAVQPSIVAALNPAYGAKFVVGHGMTGLFVLGAVFLTVTGAEALYADMGHFGRWPIQASWLGFVMPALFLNYLGQGAFVLDLLAKAGGRPVANADWFFLMAPEVYRAPLVVLAAVAGVIASQAVITGAFSLTHQAMQLGLLPRLTVRRTSEARFGEVYMPQVNLILAIGVVFLVAVFKSSTSLGNAYGLAVTGTMAVTTSLAFVVVRNRWRWPLAAAVAVIGPLLALDLVFLGANALKVFSGGYVPVVIGAAMLILMITWVRGSEIIAEKTADDTPLLDDLLPSLRRGSAHRVAGTAVFLTSQPDHVPGALLHNLKHNRVLHERNLIVSVRTADTPRVAEFERARVEHLDDGFTRVSLTFGYMEEPNVPQALAGLRKAGVKFDVMATSFFLGRKSIVASAASRLPRLLSRLFVWMTRNAADPTDVFHIPPGRVVELGSRIAV